MIKLVRIWAVIVDYNMFDCNVVVYGLEIVRFLSCLKVALYVFDKMS